MKTFGGVEVQFHTISALSRDLEMSGQLHAPGLYPGERTPSTHWIGSWMGPRDSLDAVAKRKNPFHYWELNPSYPSCSLVTTLTELL
jgi:hypothetical protein